MAEQFYTILTAVGKAKIANAAALGKKIELTELALGDGGGSYYNPTEDQTELRNEVWRGAIGNVDVDEENPNWIIIQTVVPSQYGGFMIREAGVFDNEGDLIAVGKYPETYKPAVADGSIKDLIVRMILKVSNTASVVLKVDPTVILATQQQVDEAEARAKQYTDQEVGEVSQALDEHLAENATEAHDGISILNDNIIVTVGDNGDFSTINEALNYLTTKYPAYKSGGNVTATIKLLSGFVMSEQVLVRGLDLGWIKIVGEDAETTIERSALTINFTIDDYGLDSFPAFGVSKGGTLPIIGQLFVMDDSGDRVNRHGVVAIDNSRATIKKNCGVKNAGGNGISATRSSTIMAEGANFSGAGVHGIFAGISTIIGATGADVSGAGQYGVYAARASIIEAVLVNASGAAGRGICAVQASTIDAWGADASGAGEHGIYANQGSIINAQGANASNAGEHGIFAVSSAIINANLANASNAGTHGIYAAQASTIEAWGADASGAGGYGIYALQASIINAVSVNARKGKANSAEDICVALGSIIRIQSTGDYQTIGGTNQTINTLTGNGIIFG